MENVQRQVHPVKENAGQDAREYWQHIKALPELERFCELAKAEMRGQLITRQWQRFIEYFEVTKKYRANRELIEKIREEEYDRCLREGLPTW